MCLELVSKVAKGKSSKLIFIATGTKRVDRLRHASSNIILYKDRILRRGWVKNRRAFVLEQLQL